LIHRSELRKAVFIIIVEKSSSRHLFPASLSDPFYLLWYFSFITSMLHKIIIFIFSGINIAFSIEAVSISIDKTGTVTVFDPEGRGTSLGVIELYTFPNPAGLFSLGHNLYRPTDASGEAISGTSGSDGVGTIAQGFLEMSNVDVVEEMVSMIMAQLAYEINSKAIQTADNILQIANNINR